MLEIMYNSCPVAGEVQGASESIGLEQAPMAQQHVGHLQHRRHMRTAASSKLAPSAVCGIVAIVSLFEKPLFKKGPKLIS